uniref:Uncharacterized protein n=1 Tax=Arundo donax TaxID=35708 RepID=A0A0A9BUQ9_ARUDO
MVTVWYISWPGLAIPT